MNQAPVVIWFYFEVPSSQIPKQITTPLQRRRLRRRPGEHGQRQQQLLQRQPLLDQLLRGLGRPDIRRAREADRRQLRGGQQAQPRRFRHQRRQRQPVRQGP